MPTGGPGIARYDPLYLTDHVWIDGVFVVSQPGIQITDAPSIVLLPTHGRTHILQSSFGDDLAPVEYNAKTFTLKVTANGQAEWESLRRTKAKDGAFYFTCGTRQCDRFVLTAGQTGRLSRPLAIGIVTGVAAPDYSTVVWKNGAVDADAATVTGQNVVCAESGTLEIEYTPAFAVVITGWTETIIGHNHAEVDLTLEETLVA